MPPLGRAQPLAVSADWSHPSVSAVTAHALYEGSAGPRLRSAERQIFTSQSDCLREAGLLSANRSTRSSCAQRHVVTFGATPRGLYLILGGQEVGRAVFPRARSCAPFHLHIAQQLWGVDLRPTNRSFPRKTTASTARLTTARRAPHQLAIELIA